MRRKSVFSLLSSSVFLGMSVVHAAPFVNGDFTSFDGWSGDKGDFFGGVVVTVSDEAGLSNDANFNDVNRATLANDAVNFGVSLYQDFDSPANVGAIRFDFSWTLTDFQSDEISALLLDANTLQPVVDLFQNTAITADTGGGAVNLDISTLLPGSYRMEFSLIDGDFNENDRFHVANIAFTDTSSVAAPLPILSMITGLVGIWLARKRPS